MIDLYRDVTIGEFTAFGPRCTLMTHGVFWPSTWGLARKIGGISVGDLSWVANNCTITADVKIGSRVLVMAGSVVSRDIEEPSLVIDVPRNRTVLPHYRVQKRHHGGFPSQAYCGCHRSLPRGGYAVRRLVA